MTIPEKKIYPRTGDRETVYLKNVITDPNILVGDYTMYHDFVNDPRLFEKNNVLYHYPINHDRLIIGKFCSIDVYKRQRWTRFRFWNDAALISKALR